MAYRNAKRRKIPRMKILRRDNYICGYCFENQATTVDHIIPVAYKDNPNEDNLIACCTRCNSIAGSKVFSSIQEKRDYINSTIKTSPKWKSKADYIPTELFQYNSKTNQQKPKEKIQAAKKITHIRNTTWDNLREKIQDEYAELNSLRKVASNHPGLTFGVIQRILGGHEPKKPEVRWLLGLPLPIRIIDLSGEEITGDPQVFSYHLCNCGKWFVPNNSMRKKCYSCSPPRSSQ